MIGDKIKQLRMEREISQEDLAKALGYKSRSSIHNIEQGITDIPLSKAKEFAKFFSVSPAYLMGWEEAEPADMAKEPLEPYGANIFEFPESVMVPVYGKISAGTPIEAIEVIEEYIDVPKKWIDAGKKIIGLVVDGDSMYPRYMDGDVVVIECGADFHSGDDCAVYVNGYEATIKQVKRTTDGVELIPVNTAYAPKRYKDGEYSVLGVILEMRRKVLNK